MREISADTLVIGAGISGLACAHARATLGADVLVLEAAPRAGGLVRTVAVLEHGLCYEHGPEAFAGGSRELTTLFRALGLEPAPLPAATAKGWVVHRARLVEVPLSPAALLETPLLSAGAKLWLASERFRGARTALDGSIADFVRHRLGAEVLERLVDPLIGGIHAGDPERLSLRACFPEVARWVQEHGSLTAALAAKRTGRAPGAVGGGLWRPRGGMQRATDALAAALGERLRLSTPARALTRVGARWRVATDAGSFSAPRVVLALPLAATVELLASAAPEAARALAGMESESLVALVHAHARADVAHPLDGFGYLVPSSEGASELGTLFSSSIDPECAPADTVLLRTLLGGARAPGLVERPDEELGALVEREVGARLGIRAPARWARVERYRRALPRYDLEHPARVEALERALPPGLSVLGNFTRGLGVGALVARALELARSQVEPEPGRGA